MRALAISLLVVIAKSVTWPAVLGILAAAGLWHVGYRLHYGRWPPLD